MHIIGLKVTENEQIGKIASCDGKFITVKFANKTKLFSFPSSIDEGRLSFIKDEEWNNRKQSEEQNRHKYLEKKQVPPKLNPMFHPKQRINPIISKELSVKQLKISAKGTYMAINEIIKKRNIKKFIHFTSLDNIDSYIAKRHYSSTQSHRFGRYC